MTRDTNDGATGVQFDVNSFMSGVLDTIGRYRSDVGSSPSQIIENTQSLTSGEHAESRMNVFFRLLGLPAVRNLEILTIGGISASKTQLNQHGTLNYINSNSISVQDPADPGGIPLSGAKLGDKIAGRETVLLKPLSPERMKEMIKSPLPIDASVAGVSGRKPSMFPMIVDAATPVYPLRRRAAPLFFDGDFILSGESGVRLPRPFIESIFYIRSYFIVGGNTDEVKQKFKNNIETFVLSNTGGEGEGGTSFLDALELETGAYFSEIELEIIAKLIQALRASSSEYQQVVKRASELSQRVKFSPIQPSGHGIKTGNTTKIIEDSVSGELDIQMSRVQFELEKVAKRTSSLPTAKIMEAENQYRIDANITNLNVTADAFISDFSSLITFDQPEVDGRLAKLKKERGDLLTEFNQVLEKLQYFTGEDTGLSVIDVICTFIGLFTVDIENLAMLLNQDSRDRLANNPYYSFQNSPTNTSIYKKPIFTAGENFDRVEYVLGLTGAEFSTSDALEALRVKVTDAFALSRAFYGNSSQVTPESPSTVGNNFVYNLY